jgi:hypothetical protein
MEPKNEIKNYVRINLGLKFNKNFKQYFLFSYVFVILPS